MEDKDLSKAIRIDDWSCCLSTNDPYTPPEMIGLALQGWATNHPRLGTNRVWTSRIVGVLNEKCGNRYVFTESGSVYLLGRISKRYRVYLKKIRQNWNWRKPVTLLDGENGE